MHVFNEDMAVAHLAELIALECGMQQKEARLLRNAAALHDIGKVAIPPALLCKPGKLTHDEFEIMKTHTVLGAEMLRAFHGTLGEMAAAIAEFHHERYDKQGYWRKDLSEIPPYIPYVSIADIFTALVSPRPYKKPWPPADALAYIREQSGIIFNPSLVEVFISLVQSDNRAAELYKKSYTAPALSNI